MTAAAHVEYEGLKIHAGWRFTLTPQADWAGAPGFLLHQLQPSDADREWANQRPRLPPPCELSVEDKTAFIECRPDEWREEVWLREWLRHGLIRKAVAQ